MAEASSPGTTAPTWSVTWDVTPPRAAFQGSATTATATNESSAMRTAHTAVAMTFAPSTPGPDRREHERRRDRLVPVLAGDAEDAHDRGQDLNAEVPRAEELASLAQRVHEVEGVARESAAAASTADA